MANSGTGWRRMRLRRADGRVYLDRWGIECGLFGVFLHRMNAPDPGLDLHDHPWTFVTIPLWGGYDEYRAPSREAPWFARVAEMEGSHKATRGIAETVEAWHPRLMRLDECHRIHRLHRPTVWTLVLRGPKWRKWGFFLPTGWMNEHEYDATVRVNRRDLWNETGETQAFEQYRGSDG